MGNSKQRTINTEDSRSTQQTTFDPASLREQAIMDDYYSLGRDQSNFLKNMFHGKTGMYDLSSPDQQRLDEAYQSAFDRFNLQGKDYADYLSSTRGLNKSDTPVSQQAMERYGLGMSDLLSQRANARLNLGFQGNMAKLGAIGMTPGGMNAAFAPMYNERMAGGMTTRTGRGTTDQTQYSSPSVMQQVQQGMGIAAGAGMMAGGLMTQNPMMMMGGLGQLNGGGGGMGWGNLFTKIGNGLKGPGFGAAASPADMNPYQLGMTPGLL